MPSRPERLPSPPAGTATVAGQALEVIRPQGTLHVEVVGDDAPVLLLHQAFGSFASFHDTDRGNVAQWLEARGCRVIGIDLPGHGRSYRVEEFTADYLDQCVEDVSAVVAHLGIQRAAVVAVGFGALVALRVAANYPHLASCVVADSLPGVSPAVPFEPWPGLVPSHALLGRERQLTSWRRFAQRLDSEPILPEPKRVRCPVLLAVCGDSNSSDLVAGVYELAQSLPHGNVALLPGDRPPACWQSPGFFVREVERFLAAYA